MKVYYKNEEYEGYRFNGSYESVKRIRESLFKYNTEVVITNYYESFESNEFSKICIKRTIPNRLFTQKTVNYGEWILIKPNNIGILVVNENDLTQFKPTKPQYYEITEESSERSIFEWLGSKGYYNISVIKWPSHWGFNISFGINKHKEVSIGRYMVAVKNDIVILNKDDFNLLFGE